MVKNYEPVTVNVTWMVSSPAVLLTQQRYFPLSSNLAYIEESEIVRFVEMWKWSHERKNGHKEWN